MEVMDYWPGQSSGLSEGLWGKGPQSGVSSLLCFGLVVSEGEMFGGMEGVCPPGALENTPEGSRGDKLRPTGVAVE